MDFVAVVLLMFILLVMTSVATSLHYGQQKIHASMAAWSSATLFVTVSAPTYRQEEESWSTRPFSMYIAVDSVCEVTWGPKVTKDHPPKPLFLFVTEIHQHVCLKISGPIQSLCSVSQETSFCTSDGFSNLTLSVDSQKCSRCLPFYGRWILLENFQTLFDVLIEFNIPKKCVTFV